MSSSFSMRQLIIIAAIASTASAWEVCPCGSSCARAPPAGYLSRVKCQARYYCPQGAFHAISKAVLCPAGNVCPTAGLCYPQPCPCGSYCPPGSSQAIQCTKGSYCPVNASAPIACSDPASCPSTGLCAPQPQTTTPATCDPAICDITVPDGFICSLDPTLGCGLICIDLNVCSSAPPPNTGTTNVNTQKVKITTTPAAPICGFYVPPGFPVQIPCKAGDYCPLAPNPTDPIVPRPCPAGAYCPAGACAYINCTCGYKCPPRSSAPTECLPPFYCPGVGNSHQTLCPIGYKCPDKHMCTPIECQPGSYVSCGGKVTCDPCSPGRYCPDPKHSVLCPKGYYCPPGASAPAPCPAGYKCHLGSSAPQKPARRLLEAAAAAAAA